ncbi:hypothetical protein SeLEV6574_g04269 [Synchytrium endobioticum]|uniref:BSD domain-containing protein n=1 Tax=Synchytrium endobioticum TaxID=286115 RepID=A0A507D0I9_9FUNG|nr:hypothetical protein SeLEV6574_g04269 [Synchytrium endobioticum]
MANDIRTQHTTADDAREHKLKVELFSAETHTFQFQDRKDRNDVKELVAKYIKKNNPTLSGGAATTSTAPPSIAFTCPPQSSLPSTPLPVVPTTSPQASARSGLSSKRKRVAAGSDGQVPLAEMDARKALLNKSKALQKLFKDLVVTGTIDEEEFWEVRKSELETATFQAGQKSGNLYVSLADIRPVEEDNTIAIKMTAEKVHSIFLQNPALLQAYNQNVPEKVSETDFWTRYFASKYFYRSRRVVGSVAELGNPDPIFDSLKEVLDIDANPDPRKTAYNAFNKLIDLSTTAEDHQENGNTPDVTMVAGKRKEFLPIIRKFNRISEDVLQQTLKDSDPRKKIDRSAKGLGSLYLKETELEELEAFKPTPIQPLAIQEDIYFDTQSALSHMASKGASNYQQSSDDFKTLIQSWTPKFPTEVASLKTDAVLRSATEAAKRRKQGYAVDQKPAINIYPQLIDRQNSTMELLRHFWGAFNRPNKMANAEKLAGALRTVPKVLGDFLKEHPEAPMATKLMESTISAVEKALWAYEHRGNTAL